MLVLTRKLQEQICIGDNVTISVLKIKGNTVRIGIDAPRDVRVLRGEIPQFDAPADETGNQDATPGNPALAIQHQPMVGMTEKPMGPKMPPSSHLRRLVQQVVSVHAV